MSRYSYAHLAPLIYNEAIAGDAARIHRLLQAPEVKTDASLMRQISALLLKLSWTESGACTAWGEMRKESGIWRSVRDQCLPRSKVSLTEPMRVGKGPITVARHVANLLEEDPCEFVWITGGDVPMFTQDPEALNVLGECLGNNSDLHLIDGGTLGCGGVLQLIELGRKWEGGVSRQQILLGPLYPPAWWPVVDAPYLCDTASLTPGDCRAMIIHLGASPLNVLLDSTALMRNGPDQRLIHYYLITPHGSRVLDSSESEELMAAAADEAQLKEIALRAAERAWEFRLTNGPGAHYHGRPEDLQFGDSIAAAALLGGDVDVALIQLRLSKEKDLQQQIGKSRDNLEWAMAKAGLEPSATLDRQNADPSNATGRHPAGKKWWEFWK